MNRRTWLCIALLLTPAACSRGGGPVGGPARQAVVDDAITERPSLREIFRNGRYTFLAANAELRKWAHRRLEQNRLAQQALDKLSIKVVRAERGGGPIVIYAMVGSDVAVEDPATWDGFMRGLSKVADAEVEEGEIGGVQTAYVSVPRGRTLAMYYAPDLIIRLESLSDTPRQELEDLARYLLQVR